MQWFLAKAIAGEEQLAARLVIDGDGKHAAQLLNAIGTQVVVEVKDALGVGFGGEAMAAAFEIRTQLGKVVDFAVEDDPGTAIFVEDGLMSAGNVDDGKAAHAEARTVSHVDAIVIRAAVADGVAHVTHESFGDIALASCADDSGYATHDRTILSPFILSQLRAAGLRAGVALTTRAPTWITA